MARTRISIQVKEADRKKIDKLVSDRKVRSISDCVRLALEQFLEKS